MELVVYVPSHDSLYAIPYVPLPFTVRITAPESLTPDTGTVIDGWRIFDCESRTFPCDGAGFSDVLAIAINSADKVWVGTNAGLARYDDTAWSVFDTANSPLPGNRVFGIDFDNQGNLWTGTCPGDWSPERSHEGGISKYDGSAWTVFTTANSSLPSGNIFSVHIDAGKIPWAGMFGLGVARLTNGTWQTVEAGTLFLSVPRCITTDPSGAVWIAATYLYRYDGLQWNTVSIPSKKYGLTSSLNCLAFGSGSQVWVGGFEGLFTKQL
ncbi:MAG: hypothetical protein JW913_13520 [Chitinispirillaceae bacterium]|nr:hypothetical protein [Chitinispirillaceae bacterium]